MAFLEQCADLGYVYSDSFCLLVEVDQEQDEFTADTAWIVGATFLGLILGALIVLLLARPFVREWEKKKKQDEDILLEEGVTAKTDVVETKAVNGWVDSGGEKEKVDEKGKKLAFFKNPGRFFKKKKNIAIAAVENTSHEIKENEEKKKLLSRGMADIMVQTNSASTEVEMANQDMMTIREMEKGREEEKETLLLSTLALLLKKKMEKKAVTENFYYNFTKKTEEEVKDLNKMVNKEREEAEEKLQKDPKLSKDVQALETEMEKTQSHFNNKQNQLQREYKNHIRHELLRSSGMSEAEVDDLMDKLMKNMAFVEEKLGLEQARQRRALEQRLAKRRQAVEFQEAEMKEGEKAVDSRVESLKNLLTVQSDDNLEGKLEMQSDEIVMEYAADLENLRTFHAKEYNGLALDKLNILANVRKDSILKLVVKQDKEKAALLQTANKKTHTDFAKLYHELMVKHHMEQETLNGELDQREVQELYKLKQESAKELEKAMNAETEKLTEKLDHRTNLTSTEASKILKLHKQEVSNLNAKRQREKQAMMTRLNEKLQQRLAAADEAEARDQREQEVLKEEQMATLNKVLATNMDLTEEAKERILREHEQNMQALSNQLLNSKLRQQKSLEIKLNQRKVRLAELRQQKEEIERSKKITRQKEKEDVEAKLLAEIAKEEEDFENARKQAVSDLRKRLSDETDEALKQRDEEIGLLIGRLQVGQARRKAVLEKQDQALKQLQDELEKKVASGAKMPVSLTDQLLQQHQNQIAYTNEQLQKRREYQEKMIMEKLARKKTFIEMEIENQLEEDAQQEYKERQSKGAGYASLALMQSFLEQRHTKAMQSLETEMLAELEKGKSELNMQLELELRKELEEQRQNLLTQLAAVSKMSKQDLQDAVDSATQGQYDTKAAQKLARDLKEGVSKAKSAMDYADERDEDEYAHQRPGSGNVRSGRKGSAAPSLRRAPRQTYGIDEEDEEGF